ncbi:BA75_04377T0 [Komagataella pastoris]|uniref:Kinesin-like protein n=1 Tax=Komagataella pastoris TaxID=4922 RepID=A0A1B2JIF4_PICPA|nr:BA75_04377T0 [Komagataella pastoris]
MRYLSRENRYQDEKFHLAKDTLMQLINERAKLRYCHEKTRDEFEILYDRTISHEDEIKKVFDRRQQLEHNLKLKLRKQQKEAFILFRRKKTMLKQSVSTVKSKIINTKLTQLALDERECQELLQANKLLLRGITTVFERRIKQQVWDCESSMKHLVRSNQSQEKTFRMLIMKQGLRKRDMNNELSQISAKRPFLSSQKKILESDYRSMLKQKSNTEENSKLITITRNIQKSSANEIKDNHIVESSLQDVKALSANHQHQLQNKEFKTIRLHNKLQDLKGNLRVYCRVRPLATDEQESIGLTISDMEWSLKERITVHKGAADSNSNYAGKSVVSEQKKYTFHFDKVFSPFTTNTDIFWEISQLIHCSLEGTNVTIFAYGQTGSGKSFTMSKVDDGLISRSMDLLFNKRNKDIRIFVQLIEIYNDKLFNLLEYKRNKPYEIRHNKTNRTTEVLGMDEILVDSQEQMKKMLLKAEENKRTFATNMNERSSRSHTVFRFIFRSCKSNCLISTLHLIDLAGSERISQSKVIGDRLKETQYINKSLSCLNNVIHSINQNYHHIPYRNSKLTYLLQYSLEPTSKTLMFVNVNPNKLFFNETLTSLRFAEKVNGTKVIYYDT